MCVERKIIKAFAALYVISATTVFVIGNGASDNYVVRIKVRIDVVTGNRRGRRRRRKHLRHCGSAQIFQLVFVKRLVGRNHVQYGEIRFELFHTNDWWSVGRGWSQVQTNGEHDTETRRNPRKGTHTRVIHGAEGRHCRHNAPTKTRKVSHNKYRQIVGSLWWFGVGINIVHDGWEAQTDIRGQERLDTIWGITNRKGNS